MKSPKVLLVGLASLGIAASLLVSTTAVASKAKLPPGVVTAQRIVLHYQNPNPVITLPPLSAKPPTGKSLDFITCPVAVCIQIQDGVQAAAAKLGWTVNVIEGGQTPSAWISAMDQAVQNPGDAVLGIGLLPNTSITSELTALAAKNVPWIPVASPSPVGQQDELASFNDPASTAVSGKLMADWIVANSKGNAHVVFYWDPIFSTLLGAKADFSAEMNRLCPKCSVNIQTTSFTSGVGTTDPGQVVSYLQAHPSTNYIAWSGGDFIVGVPQAIAAAGLSKKVKIVTRAADIINMKDMAAGRESAGVTAESSEIGWRMVDVAARYFLGDSTDCCTSPIGTVHILTKSDLPHNLNVPWTVPHYQTYFLSAWHLG